MLLLLCPAYQLFFFFLFLFFVFVSESCNFLMIVIGTIAESPMSDAFLWSNVTPVAKAN